MKENIILIIMATITFFAVTFATGFSVGIRRVQIEVLSGTKISYELRKNSVGETVWVQIEKSSEK